MNQNCDLPFLGYTADGNPILGGFFTAHDTHGFHTDWFMPIFLEKGYRVSVPYFQCECMLSPARDPDVIWPMLEIAYKEAKLPFDLEESKRLTKLYLANEFNQIEGITAHEYPLVELAKVVINKLKRNGQNELDKIKQGDKHVYSKISG